MNPSRRKLLPWLGQLPRFAQLSSFRHAAWRNYAARFKQYAAISLLMALGILLLVSLSLTGRSANPNPDPVAALDASGAMRVVLKQNHLYQYVASGRINGQPVEFLVDTGAADVAMPYTVAQRLKLSLRPGGRSKTGNGDVESWSAQLDSVDVGGLMASRVRAVVLPNMQGEQVLLGMSYLRHMELMLAGGELTLRPYVSR